MDFLESLRLSLRSIRGHGLRSALTTLGIVIGIAAVITFVTLGTSVQAAVIGDVAGQTRPEMTVSAGPASGPPGAGQSVPVFTERDVDRLRNQSQVAVVVPSGTVQVGALEHAGQTLAWPGVTATTPAAFDGRTFAAGGPFEQGAREVVLNDAAARLFEERVESGDRLGVRLEGGRTVEATVAGVVNASATIEVFGNARAQPRVFVPTDPFYRTTVTSPTTGAAMRAYPALTVRATSFDAIPAVEDAVEAYLAGDADAARLVPAGYEITVLTNEQIVDRIREVLSTFTGFVTGIAVISLVVGAIGIANIMLVSVTERTREIGVMKAVGAQSRDVLQLFLLEAVVLGVIGAVGGTLLGVAGGYAVTTYVDVPTVYATRWFGVAVAVGVGVGVVAGLYPAWSAARVDPIEALRYE